MLDVKILGAGLAGLGAAQQLASEGINSIIYERKSYYGGHAASFEKDGYIFDDGPHISFTPNQRIREIFHEAVNHDLHSFKPRINNYWRGYWIKHPAQVNLSGLPPDLVATIVEEMFQVASRDDCPPSTYRQWLYSHYGKTFSETFPIAYAKKYHTIDAGQMDVDWIGPRMYQPKMREVLLGALQSDTEDVYYVKDFFYPNHGGFAAFLGGLIPSRGLELNHEVTRINHVQRQLFFDNGFRCAYEELISSLPLPELIKLVDDVPSEVVEAANKLACSICVTINIGVERDDISDVHWSYFYDDDILFSRISFPHLLSPNNVPANHGSVQAEIYFSNKYKPLSAHPDALIAPTIDDLIQCGILRDTDVITYKEARVIPYANVIFDLERQEALKKVHEYLNTIGISYCGRFGDWGYHWTDDALLSGEAAAQKVLGKVMSQ